MVGPRVYERHEVDELIPELRRVFGELGGIRSRLQTLKIKTNTLELIWGEAIHETENTDHAEYQHHLDGMRTAQEEFEELKRQIAELGGQMKGVTPPLVDFFGVREGRLILWCWSDGEDEVTHWHHVDEGFAGRQPV